MWHIGTSSRQVRGAQLEAAGTRHAPAALQVPAAVKVAPTQEGFAHIVPAG